MPSNQINITLGTAGHIDHGKTALIKCFTGCDTDRLKEEKERGMSIDLGYAPCTISDLEVGIVDVPGHENFIKTMVAGAACIDAVIFVVAADDGVMPQTLEHLDILTLLGIRHGIVALTKIDRVKSEELNLVRQQVQEFLQGTFLEDAPILPLSSITGQGFDDFLEALKELVAGIKPKRIDGLFRLPIDRAFSARGYGSVIAGIPVSGSIHIGDEIVLLPLGQKGRIKNIQVYSQQSDTAQAGQCAALNIPQFDQKTVERGQSLTVGQYFKPSLWFLAELTLLPHDKLFLKNAQHVKFHTGTSQVEATVYLMQSEKLQQGQQDLVQIRLNAPLIAGPKDRFIIRTISPAVTIGGGMIVEAIEKKLKRSDPAIVQDVRQRADAVKTDKDFLAYCIKRAPGYVANTQQLSQRTKIAPALIPALIEELLQQHDIIQLQENQYVHSQVIKEIGAQLLTHVEQFHRREPQSPGVPKDELARTLSITERLLDRIVSDLISQGTVTETNQRLALPDHQSEVPRELRDLLDKVEDTFRRKGFAPPGFSEVSQSLQLDSKQLQKLANLLVEHGRLVPVADNLFFHIDAVERGRKILIEYLQKEKKLESVKFKYLIDTTRKFALPLLDYFDRIGLTRRVGYTRYLQNPTA